MTIYVDEEFPAHTLADLLIQVQEKAREVWFREIEDEVIYAYRRLACEDVKQGRSLPSDHPMWPPASFVESPYDLNGTSTIEIWERELTKQLIDAPVAVFHERKEPKS